jgi:hypothetical protein
MHHITSIPAKALLLAVPLCVGAPDEAWAQMLSPAPPAAFIATTQPEYFENRSVYWYQDHWFYRDGLRWNVYRTEPPYLRSRRSNWGSRPRYHYYR